MLACDTLERVPINWNQLIGKTTLYFKVLERLGFAQSGEKRSRGLQPPAMRV
jgi:hypothetical protein